MARNKKVKKGAPAWMVSYCDLQQLLLVFFILLFSTSVTDTTRLHEVLSSFTGTKYMIEGSPADTIVELNTQDKGESEQKDTDGEKKYAEQSLSEKKYEILNIEHEKQSTSLNSKDAQIIEEELKEKLAKDEKNLDEKIEVTATTEGVLVRFKDGVLFEPGEVEIKPEAKKILTALGESIDNKSIRIEGHTDNVPTGNSMYANNWELSTARSMSVMKELTKMKLITEEKCTVAGHSEFKPIAPNNTIENKSLNRRVDIILLRK